MGKQKAKEEKDSLYQFQITQINKIATSQEKETKKKINKTKLENLNIYM